MATYHGIRTPEGGVIVTVRGQLEDKLDGERALNPRFDLRSHSSAPFDWGAISQSSSQLALALLADHCRDDARAVRLYQGFRLNCVLSLPHLNWTLTGAQIEQELADLERGR